MYAEYKKEGGGEELSIKEYLKNIRPYLRYIIMNDLKKSG